MRPMRLETGSPGPLGAHFDGEGVNLAVWSHHAERIEWCVFDPTGAHELARHVLPARSGDIFHGRLAGAGPGLVYGLRAWGPYAPEQGHRFNPNKLLLDPYARELVGQFQWHPAVLGYQEDHPQGCLSFDTRDSAPHVPKARVCTPLAMPSPRRPRPGRPWGETVLYEMHVRGFSRQHPGIPEPLRGTVQALAHPRAIEHLREIGVTAVELLPIAAWVDELHLTRRGLSNYWGYNPLSFFAMQPALAGPQGVSALVDAVERLHEAGIEVLLDVVFNHTAEGDERGPTLSLRGLDNASYYLPDPHRPGGYANLSGCGNTLAAHHPAVSQLIVDSLRYWALEVGVDGFRFDLASAIARDARGRFDAQQPWLRAIHDDPQLSRCKWIAEAWDAGGHFVGEFPRGWSEWNDRYRDDVRRFWRSDAGQAGALATRLAGSSDLFGHSGRSPGASINFITAHDGMTLADLVRYRHRHNEANGEDNRDGAANDHSDDCGGEATSQEPEVVQRRLRRMRAMLATLMLSRGVPMLRAGDEFGASQQGNNNAYCHDGPLTWLDWPGGARPVTDLRPLLGVLARLRRELRCLRRDHFYSGQPVAGEPGLADITWLDEEARPMAADAWHDSSRRSLAALLDAGQAQPGMAHDRLWLAFTSQEGPVRLRLPDPGDGPAGMGWVGLLDTASDAIQLAPGQEVTVEGPAVLAYGSGQVATMARQRWQIGLPAASLCPADDPRATVEVVTDEAAQTVSLTGGAGGPAQVLSCGLGQDTTVIESAWLGSQRLHRHRLALGRALPAGTHPLSASIGPGQPSGAQTLSDGLIHAAPTRCFVPAVIERPQGAWALSAQLYSLHGPDSWGIGDFGNLADLCEQAARIGAAGVLTSPLHAPSLCWPDRGSPYSPSSRVALNPLFVSLPVAAQTLACPGFAQWLGEPATRQALDAVRSAPGIDYPAVIRLKRAGFEQLWQDLQQPANRAQRETFVRWWAQSRERLRAHALFEALAEHLGEADWRRWPHEFSLPDAPGARSFLDAHPEQVGLHAFIQWLAAVQWQAVGERAHRAGAVIGPIADLAVGCDPGGADAWTRQALMASDFELGAPPDPLGPDGQAWGLPPWRPDELAKQGWAPFAGLLSATMAGAGGLRIDHVMALERLFWVPRGGKAASGTYVPYPLETLLHLVAAHSARLQCLVIGEDLGTVRDGLRERLASAGVLSCKVAWFEQGADGWLADPASLPVLSMACASTHDLPTIDGWAAGRDIEEREQRGEFDAERADRERQARQHALRGVLATLDRRALTGRDLTERIHKWLAASSAGLAIVQLEDITGLVRQANLPGMPDVWPNWRQRLPVALNDLGGLVRWRDLAHLFQHRSSLHARPSQAVAAAQQVSENLTAGKGGDS